MNTRKQVLITTLIALIALMSGIVIQAQDDAVSTSTTTDAPDRERVSVTIYNEGTALIQDVRIFDFDAGLNVINFRDVAATIDPTSVSFSSVTDPDGTYVLEQNYVYDLVGTDALLRRYIDQTIEVTTEDGTIYTGELLAGQGGDIILRAADGSVVVINTSAIQDIQFPNLPDGLITRPTLRWLIEAANAGANEVELTYLARGMNWEADYTVLLNADNTALDLNGWVTLNNNSGTAYQDAQVKLIAGDVNRIREEVEFAFDDAVMMEAVPQTARGGVEQREFFEYQLYEIARPVTIGNNETKQVEFVSGADVSATTFFVYDASVRFYGWGGFYTEPSYGMTGITDVNSYLEFSTDEENGLGADLPAGRIRVYQEDIDGAALLIGENRIDHTPEGEDIQIYLGNAFDLVGERIQTAFNRISSNTVEESFEIRLRNRKDTETVTIRVPERLTRWQNWEIIESNYDYEQLDAYTIQFEVAVEPGEEAILTYTVRYTNTR